eukprot:TRINITY_DN501_c0_g1_i1.p1 TRINITY_DN501_c0_g1~~TRINITY_DN501_c0_g1_i1.p1  ORF type:complete len:397 (-),score=58.51 TRINITY_DN501_c0_g1_i1:1019-2209(-)
MFSQREEDLCFKLKSIEDMVGKAPERKINPLFASYMIRCMVVGESGSGKTTFVFNRLLDSVEWTRILVIAPRATLEHESYIKFKEVIDKKITEPLRENEVLEEDEEVVNFVDVDDPMAIPSVEDLDNDQIYAIIVDDFLGAPPASFTKLNNLCTFGSKKHVHIFYLVQQFRERKLMAARRNCTSFVLFKGTPRETFKDVIENFFAHLKPDTQEIASTLRLAHSYVIMNKNAEDENKQVLFGEDKYYIPIAHRHEVRQQVVAAGIKFPSNFNPRLDSRAIILKDDKAWKNMLDINIAEYKIGNQAAGPTIVALSHMGLNENLMKFSDFKSIVSDFGLNDIAYSTNLPIIRFVRTIEEWKKAVSQYPPRGEMIALLNFGLTNKWLPEKEYKTILGQQL